MPSIADILERFRRVGAPPGAAAPAGVPRDRKSELSDELHDVFGQLDVIEAEAQAITNSANQEAERITTAARLEAQQIVEAARSAVPAMRADAEAARRRQRSHELQALDQETQERIAAMRRQVADRMPALIDRVLAELMKEAAPARDQHVELVGRG